MIKSPGFRSKAKRCEMAVFSFLSPRHCRTSYYQVRHVSRTYHNSTCTINSTVTQARAPPVTAGQDKQDT